MRRVQRRAAEYARPWFSSPSGKVQDDQQDVDDLDANERRDDSSRAIDDEMVTQQTRRADGAVLDAPQRQRNERDDDERVEDDGAHDRALRRREVHDIEPIEGRVR